MIRQPTTKILVVFDVQVKSPDVFQVPLVINYGRCSFFFQLLPSLILSPDLPKIVEDYANRLVPASMAELSHSQHTPQRFTCYFVQFLTRRRRD